MRSLIVRRHSLLIAFVTVLLQSDSKGNPNGYLTFSTDKDGNVHSAVFSGEAEWLERQVQEKSHLHKLTHLRTLELVRHSISLGYISNLQNVTTLSVGSVSWGLPEDRVEIDGRSLSQIEKMTWLKELEVDATGLTANDWAFLPKLKSLERLSLGRAIPVSDEFFSHVRKNSALERLMIKGEGSFADQAIGQLKELRKLKVLSIDKCSRLTDEGVKHLSGLTDLEELSLSGTCTVMSIEHIRPLGKLRELRLHVDRVPRAAMETLAQFKHLELLGLYTAEIGDDEIAALQGHPSLRRLWLGNARVTPGCVATLDSLRNLSHVYFGGDPQSKQIENVVNERLRARKKID